MLLQPWDVGCGGGGGCTHCTHGGGGGDRGVWTAKTVKRPRQQPAQPQYANFWAPLTRKRHIPPHSAQPQHTNHWAPRTRKRHQQEHRPQRPTESSDPTQHAKGRTGDCPGPCKGATTRRTVTQGAFQGLHPNTNACGSRGGGALPRPTLDRGCGTVCPVTVSPAPVRSCPPPHCPPTVAQPPARLLDPLPNRASRLSQPLLTPPFRPPSPPRGQPPPPTPMPRLSHSPALRTLPPPPPVHCCCRRSAPPRPF